MKITREETTRHEEAMALLYAMDHVMPKEEIEYVYEHYNPMAEHNVGKNAIFFTPLDLAFEFAAMTAPKGRIIDLCAGIGVLSYAILQHDACGGSPEIPELVAVEIDHEFVEIGKRLLPQVVWIEGSVFDQDLMANLGEFDCAISNPPYGSISARGDADWLFYQGPAHFMVAEVALRMAYNGAGLIIPEVDTNYDTRRSQPQCSGSLRRFNKIFPGVQVSPIDCDIDQYKDQWKGASPHVIIADLSADDYLGTRPLGFNLSLKEMALVNQPIEV